MTLSAHLVSTHESKEPRHRGAKFSGRTVERDIHNRLSTNIGSGIELIDDLEVGENLPRRKLFDFLLVQTVEPIKERPLVRRQFRMLFGARHGDSTCFG
jgi:hypothetical protein